MKSLAPTHIKLGNLKDDNKQKDNNNNNNTKPSNDGLVTIQRLPLFDFLQIPENLHRQFKVPSGCVITKK